MASRTSLSNPGTATLPSSGSDATSKTYVDTTTPAVNFSGFNTPGDKDAFGDLLATMTRLQLNNAINFASMAAGNQYAYLCKAGRGFGTTGGRYVTGATSGTTGNTVSLSLYSGASQASMALRATVAAAFTTTSALVQAAWGALNAVPDGHWVAFVFTCTAAGGTPPRLMTPGSNNAAGASFLNPATGSYTVCTRASTSLPGTLDFTTGWTTGALPAYVAAY